MLDAFARLNWLAVTPAAGRPRLGVILAALAPTFGEALVVGVVVGLGVASPRS